MIPQPVPSPAPPARLGASDIRASTTIAAARRDSSCGPLAAAPTTSKAAPPPALAPIAPKANVAGGFSLSRQLGLGVARIVIDPGHGGHDPGAQGKGLNEAELTLDVALRLEKLLEDEGLEVVLTRRENIYIPLEERTAIANRENADLVPVDPRQRQPQPRRRAG